MIISPGSRTNKGEPNQLNHFIMANISVNYNTSNDYKRLKELLDGGNIVVILWVHVPTMRLFSGIAKRVEPIRGGIKTPWYSIDCWIYCPTMNKETFDEFCKKKQFVFIVPNK